MTHANESAIRAAYSNIASGRLSLVSEFLDNDVIWKITGNSPVSGTYIGKEAVFGCFAKVADVYGSTFTIEVREVVANDDYGFASAVERGRVGDEFLEFNSVHVWRMNAGKCKSFTSYEDDLYHQFWDRRLQQAIPHGI